jgi:hypothetical protein
MPEADFARLAELAPIDARLELVHSTELLAKAFAVAIEFLGLRQEPGRTWQEKFARAWLKRQIRDARLIQGGSADADLRRFTEGFISPVGKLDAKAAEEFFRKLGLSEPEFWPIWKELVPSDVKHRGRPRNQVVG